MSGRCDVGNATFMARSSTAGEGREGEKVKKTKRLESWYLACKASAAGKYRHEEIERQARIHNEVLPEKR